jgi:hypothetical protein
MLLAAACCMLWISSSMQQQGSGIGSEQGATPEDDLPRGRSLLRKQQEGGEGVPPFPTPRGMDHPRPPRRVTRRGSKSKGGRSRGGGSGSFGGSSGFRGVASISSADHPHHDLEASKHQMYDDIEAARPPSQESSRSVPSISSDAASAPSSPFNTPRDRELGPAGAAGEFAGGSVSMQQAAAASGSGGWQRPRQRSDPLSLPGLSFGAAGRAAAANKAARAADVAEMQRVQQLQRIQQLEHLYVLAGGDVSVTRWDTDQIIGLTQQMEAARVRPSAP